MAEELPDLEYDFVSGQGVGATTGTVPTGLVGAPFLLYLWTTSTAEWNTTSSTGAVRFNNGAWIGTYQRTYQTGGTNLIVFYGEIEGPGQTGLIFEPPDDEPYIWTLAVISNSDGIGYSGHGTLLHFTKTQIDLPMQYSTNPDGEILVAVARQALGAYPSMTTSPEATVVHSYTGASGLGMDLLSIPVSGQYSAAATLTFSSSVFLTGTAAHAFRKPPVWEGTTASPWEFKADTLTAGSGSTMVGINGKVYLFGPDSNAAVYDPNTDAWSSLPPIPDQYGGVDYGKAIAYQGKIFCLTWRNDNFIFDPADNSYSLLGMPENGIDNTWLMEVDGALWCLGEDMVPERWDPDTNTWTMYTEAGGYQGEDLIEDGFAWGAAGGANGKLYFVDGWAADVPDGRTGVYSIALDSWSMLGNPDPLPREGNCIVRYGDYLLNICGDNDSDESAVGFVTALNTTSDTWSVLPSAIARSEVSACICDGYLYIAHGWADESHDGMDMRKFERASLEALFGAPPPPPPDPGNDGGSTTPTTVYAKPLEISGPTVVDIAPSSIQVRIGNGPPNGSFNVHLDNSSVLMTIRLDGSGTGTFSIPINVTAVGSHTLHFRPAT